MAATKTFLQGLMDTRIDLDTEILPFFSSYKTFTPFLLFEKTHSQKRFLSSLEDSHDDDIRSQEANPSSY